LRHLGESIDDERAERLSTALGCRNKDGVDVVGHVT
jgi:hypothetical protein